MARQKSDQKREAILEAAINVIAEQGLGAPTAAISKRAAVAHGSLFNYFATKNVLLNAVYMELTSELTDLVLEGLPKSAEVRRQLRHLWLRWTNWGVSNPKKWRTLAQLIVSDEISQASQSAAWEYTAVPIEVFRRASATGILRNQPADFVHGIAEALASATIDFMIKDPARAEAYCNAGFQTLWKALA